VVNQEAGHGRFSALCDRQVATTYQTPAFTTSTNGVDGTNPAAPSELRPQRNIRSVQRSDVQLDSPLRNFKLRCSSAPSLLSGEQQGHEPFGLHRNLITASA